MTTEKINQLFTAALDSEIKVLELKEISKDKIYNWRKGRNIPTMGDKINLLWQLGKIEINLPNQSTANYVIPDGIHNEIIKSVIEDITNEPT